MAFKIIGLGGYKEHGKDAFADGLAQNWKKIAMSDVLFQAALALDPMVNTQENPNQYLRMSELFEKLDYDYTKLKKVSPETRTILMRLGTDVGRDVLGENIWVDRVRKNVHQLWDQGFDVAVTGIRFKNELEFIASEQGQLIWVKRPGMPPPANHPSEVTLNESMFHKTILNDSDLASLHSKARSIDFDTFWKDYP